MFLKNGHYKKFKLDVCSSPTYKPVEKTVTFKLVNLKKITHTHYTHTLHTTHYTHTHTTHFTAYSHKNKTLQGMVMVVYIGYFCGAPHIATYNNKGNVYL